MTITITDDTIAEAAVVLGHEYRDSITGVQGVATGYAIYLFGCVQIKLEGTHDDSPFQDWFDEQRLETPQGATPLPTATAGGPQRMPPSRM